MSVTSFARTDKGRRDTNEDACLVITLDHPTGPFHLIAVADGLGGQAAGEVASNLAIVELREIVRRGLADLDVPDFKQMRAILVEAFRKADEEVTYQSGLAPGRQGMATTLVVALLDDEGRGVIANIGDSRAYLIVDGVAQQVTKDHSYVQELVDNGVITKEEAAVHPERNLVTRVMGKKAGDPDLFDVSLDGKLLLLCSDGFTDAVSDDELAKMCAGNLHQGLEVLGNYLIDAAIKKESKDNVTVAIAYKKRKDHSG